MVSGQSFHTYWPALLKIALVIAALIVANLLANMVLDALDFDLRPSNEETVHRTILTFALVYSLLLAVPFVPGAEIGIAMMAMLGPPIVFLVYLCTVAGLSLSFLVGRLISKSLLIRIASGLRMHRLARMLGEVNSMDSSQTLEFLAGRSPNRFTSFLLRYRYVALALAINTPGNFVIGGGGGIGLFAGISRLYSLPAYVLTVAIAVAPVPIAVLLFGSSVLGD